MLWMERISIVFGVLISAFFFGGIWILNRTVVNRDPIPLHDLYLCAAWCAGLTVAFWIFLRLIDFAFGGPQRRAMRRE